jgi:hypothetical protein
MVLDTTPKGDKIGASVTATLWRSDLPIKSTQKSVTTASPNDDNLHRDGSRQASGGWVGHK